MSKRDGETRALTEILSRTYAASSDDGSVTITASGDGRLLAAHVDDVACAGLSENSTVAVQQAIAAARAETARALADLPGLNPQLRMLLLAGDNGR